MRLETPSGFSYERAAIERNLTSFKAEDPQSRTPLTPAALVPSLLRDGPAAGEPGAILRGEEAS